jgi:uncharacterized protein
MNMAKSDQLPDFLKSKRREILRLAEQRGASNVRLFGSIARHDARLDSDVDFLVHFPPGTSIFTVVGLWRELRELLGRDVDLLTDGALDEPLKQRVMRDAVPL